MGFLSKHFKFFSTHPYLLLSLTSSRHTPISPPLLHSLPGGARRLQSGTWVPGTPAAGDRGHCARGVRDPPSRVEGGEGWRRPASARIQWRRSSPLGSHHPCARLPSSTAHKNPRGSDGGGYWRKLAVAAGGARRRVARLGVGQAVGFFFCDFYFFVWFLFFRADNISTRINNPSTPHARKNCDFCKPFSACWLPYRTRISLLGRLEKSLLYQWYWMKV